MISMEYRRLFILNVSFHDGSHCWRISAFIRRWCCPTYAKPWDSWVRHLPSPQCPRIRGIMWCALINRTADWTQKASLVFQRANELDANFSLNLWKSKTTLKNTFSSFSKLFVTECFVYRLLRHTHLCFFASL